MRKIALVENVRRKPTKWTALLLQFFFGPQKGGWSQPAGGLPQPPANKMTPPKHNNVIPPHRMVTSGRLAVPGKIKPSLFWFAVCAPGHKTGWPPLNSSKFFHFSFGAKRKQKVEQASIFRRDLESTLGIFVLHSSKWGGKSHPVTIENAGDIY